MRKAARKFLQERAVNLLTSPQFIVLALSVTIMAPSIIASWTTADKRYVATEKHAKRVADRFRRFYLQGQFEDVRITDQRRRNLYLFEYGRHADAVVSFVERIAALDPEDMTKMEFLYHMERVCADIKHHEYALRSDRRIPESIQGSLNSIMVPASTALIRAGKVTVHNPNVDCIDFKHIQMDVLLQWLILSQHEIPSAFGQLSDALNADIDKMDEAGLFD